jgi:hypothetical protein
VWHRAAVRRRVQIWHEVEDDRFFFLEIYLALILQIKLHPGYNSKARQLNWLVP